MICKNCKTEFPDDKVYCPKCGTPVQVVPDYNVLDEEVLSSYLKRLEETGKLPSIEDGLLLRKKMPRKRLFVIIGVILVLASALLFSCLSFFRYVKFNKKNRIEYIPIITFRVFSASLFP